MKLLLALILLYVVAPAAAQLTTPPLMELRYCYAVADVPRTADGVIRRNSWVRYRFQQFHPCPANGAKSGPCPGWAVDHIIPLVCGGCDSVHNMQWLPNSIKSAADPFAKDRWEQRVYCPTS